MLGNSSGTLNRGLGSLDKDKRRCSKLGEYIQEDRDWVSRVSQRTSHQKGLGLIGAGFLILSGAMLYFGSPIVAVILALLGAGTAGFIPWLHSPTKPLIFRYMPEHASTTELGDGHSPPNNVTMNVSHEGIQDKSIKPHLTDSKEDQLRAVGGGSQVLRFNPKERKKKSAKKHNQKDTFDLIIESSQNPLHKAGRKLG